MGIRICQPNLCASLARSMYACLHTGFPYNFFVRTVIETPTFQK